MAGGSLDHYTITTGDLRRSPRREVSDEAVAVCAALLVGPPSRIPGLGLLLRPTRRISDELRAEVWSDELVATIWVCRDRAALRRVLRETGAPAADISAPACLVRIETGALALQRDTLGALGDFERCLAWAWLER